MWRLLDQCTVVNGYEGLEEFRALTSADPGAALRSVWRLLTSRADPGQDDGGLCLELLRLVVATAGRDVVDRVVLDAWPSLNEVARRNVLYGAASPDALSTEVGLRLFDMPSTSVHERHLLVAGFVGGDPRPELRGRMIELAGRIGNYTEPHRQAILEQFVQDVIREYGP
jgi:hypothetical protein